MEAVGTDLSDFEEGGVVVDDCLPVKIMLLNLHNNLVSVLRLGFRFRVLGSGFRVSGSELGFRVQIQGSGFRV